MTILGQGMDSTATGLLGLDLSGVLVVPHLLVSTLVGAGFGAISSYQSLGYAASISTGLLYGLFWWIIGPLTLGPISSGVGLAWTVDEAGAAFPSLFGHPLYGGITGFGFYIGMLFYGRLRHETPVFEGEASVTRIVILGGGFGGVSAAHSLERIFWRDPSLEITLVSQSNYLLFTPMLAEVAGSALEPQHMCAPIRASLPHVQFYRCEVEAIDT